LEKSYTNGEKEVENNVQKKKLWIIPVIAAIIAMTGIFAALSAMPGGDQSQVALAADGEQPCEYYCVECPPQTPPPDGIVYRGANWCSWHASPEQIEQINKLIKEILT
jgi:hypothetical protein